MKRVLEESIILPLAKPHLFPPGSLRSPPKGVLLHGPPGTGKTLLARALAKEAQAVFLEVRIDNLFSKWVGDSEKRIAAVFSLARKLSPSIVFVDEIDSLLGQRGGSCDTPTYTHAKTVFLTEWDGLRTDERAHRVIVVGATNRPGDVDDAVLRRMPVKLRVGSPNPQERAQILSIILRKDRSLDRGAVAALPLKEIGVMCDGYTGSDLRELCKEAAMAAVREQVAEERRAAGAASPLQPAPKVPALLLRAPHFYAAMAVVGSNASFVRNHRAQAGHLPHFPLPSGLD